MKKKATMAVSERIRKRREQLGLSQLELLFRLREAGLRRSAPTLRSWESGEVSPRGEELQALAKALSTSVGWFLGEQRSGSQSNPNTVRKTSC